METAKGSRTSEESINEIEKVLQETQADRDQLTAEHDEFNADEAAFIMDTASEAIELIAHYNSDFNRITDPDSVSSLCRIISEYLNFHAGLLIGDIKRM